MLNLIKTFKSQSFRSQLLGFMVSGMLVLLLVFGSVISWLTTSRTSQMLFNNAQQVSRTFAEQAELALLTQSSDNAEAVLQQIMGFPDVSGAGLITSNGLLLIWQGIDFQQSLFSNYPWIGHQSDSLILDGKKHWYLASPVTSSAYSDQLATEFFLEDDETELLGYALVSFSKQSLHDLNQSIIYAVVLTGATIMLLLTLLVGKTIKRLTRPLDSLSRIMQRAQQTKEHIQADIDGAREVQRIAIAYNTMMKVLDAQDEKLRHHRDMLEAEVRIRTRELTQARDAALTANRHKSEFLANISHELRTPIQSIIGYIDLIREEAENEGLFHLEGDLNKVLRNADRLLGMINNLLNLAKIEAGRMDLKLRKLPLNDLISQLRETTDPLLPLNNNQFVLEAPDNNPQLLVDSEKILQVLINLVGNASKFTKGGEVRLRVSEQAHCFRFDVIDTGIGIEQQQLSLIFQQFHQVDGSEARHAGGTGLGLAISKQFIEMMQGTIEVTSTLGEGSCFSVTIPHAEENHG